MRWQELFRDLEGQLEASAAAELRAEVSDRTRRELALVRLQDRLGPAAAGSVVLTVLGGGSVRGTLLRAGPDWGLVEEDGGRDVLVPFAALLGVTGLGRSTAPPGAEGQVALRLDLRWVLRGLARDRAGVSLVLLDGSSVDGTLDRVGADHVDLAEHPAGEPRRAGAVRQVRLVPLAAIGLLRAA